MSSLESTFTRKDLETLIEAMGDWEAMGNHEFHVMQMVESMPMPPDDHEAYEPIQSIKEHFRNRKKDINAGRELRQETAIFLKAKLMLIRRDLAINGLFDFAKHTDMSDVQSEGATADKTETKVKIPVTSMDNDAVQKLERAEFFIRDLGVWKHYEEFLAQESQKASDN